MNNSTPKSLSSQLSNFVDRDDRFVHLYFTHQGFESIDPPVRAREFACPFCNSSDFVLFKVNDLQTAWMCGRICKGSDQRSLMGSYHHTTQPKRTLLWSEFCDLNAIGDLNHDVCFEKIHQNKEMVDYFLKFASNPTGLLLLQGSKGNGKTYAALGMCEYFTRTNASAIFCTQYEMQRNLILEKRDYSFQYTKSIMNCNLLVIDDLGVGDNPADFMKFLFEVIDKRTQWSNRGTIITTNLSDKDLSESCGEALCSRIAMGKKFTFKEQSRRKQKKT